MDVWWIESTKEAKWMHSKISSVVMYMGIMIGRYFTQLQNQFELWVLTCKVHIHVHKQSKSPLFALEFQSWSCFHMVTTFHFEGIAIRMKNANSFKEKLKLKSKGISFRFNRYCLQPNKPFIILRLRILISKFLEFWVKWVA